MKLPHMKQLALAAALAFATLSVQAEAPYSFAATPGKLPKNVVPVLYTAHLVPNLADNTFAGTQTVDIDVFTPASRIMLNAANMQFDGASLSGAAIGEIALRAQVDEKQETVTFDVGRELAPGRYQLALKFRGLINREARGMFHMDYKAGSAARKMLATTMEPTDARRMLPTWDEPAFRASFKLTVDVPASFKAYSNTPVEKQETLAGGMQRIRFGPTPKMPSYLVVLVAGELERISDRHNGVDIGVVTTAGKKDTGQFALESTKRLLGLSER